MTIRVYTRDEYTYWCRSGDYMSQACLYHILGRKSFVKSEATNEFVALLKAHGWKINAYDIKDNLLWSS